MKKQNIPFTVSSGQTFRTKVNHKNNGEIAVIQMKDLDANYTAIAKQPTLVYREEISEKQLLNKGDILFLSKGNNNKAFVFDENYLAVAVSLFFVIRTDLNLLLPEYLTWFLNNQSTQNILKSSREGSTVSSIRKQTLEKLKVPLPSIEKQKLVAKLYKLNKKEQNLRSLLATKREILIDNILIKSVI